MKSLPNTTKLGIAMDWMQDQQAGGQVGGLSGATPLHHHHPPPPGREGSKTRQTEALSCHAVSVVSVDDSPDPAGNSEAGMTLQISHFMQLSREGGMTLCQPLRGWQPRAALPVAGHQGHSWRRI